MSLMRTLAALQQSDQVVHVLPGRTARALQRRGWVRFTVVSPVPDEGIAVNLTVTGKSVRIAAPVSQPAPEQPTESPPQP